MSLILSKLLGFNGFYRITNAYAYLYRINEKSWLFLDRGKTYHLHNKWCILKCSFELKPPSFWHWLDMMYGHNGLVSAKNKTKNKNTIIENAHFQFEINAFIQNGKGLLGNRYRCTQNCHPRPKQITASYRLQYRRWLVRTSNSQSECLCLNLFTSLLFKSKL